MILNQNILSKTDEHGGSLEVSSEKMFTHPVVSVKKERSKRSAAAAHDIDDAIASVPTATIPQYTPSPYLLEGTVTVPV